MNMEIRFRSRKDERIYSSHHRLVRRFGPQEAKRILQRLAELGEASSLAVMWSLPSAGCHELTGDRAGQFAVNLKHPYRLIFTPDGETPRLTDGGIDREKVTAIVIIERVNYHG
jgi:plasmid maintenance system killer protein